MDSKTVLITGCSSGIGAALVKAFSDAGYMVFASARKIDSIRHLEADRVRCFQLDVTNPQHITKIKDFLIDNNLHIDVLVNNAGYASFGPSLELSDIALKQQFDTNVFAPLSLIREISPIMIANKKGMIINIGSVSGILTTPFAGAYCASKAAIHSFSEALRMELAPFNIKVVCVQPGAIQSSFGNNAETQVEQTFVKGSLYEPIAGAIRERAMASQKRPTPTDIFAKDLVEAVSKPRVKSTLRIGNGSTILPLLARLLPSTFLDKMLSASFKLGKLSS